MAEAAVAEAAVSTGWEREPKIGNSGRLFFTTVVLSRVTYEFSANFLRYLDVI